MAFGLFKDSKIGLILLITHILASISVGFIFRWWKFNSTPSYSYQNKKELQYTDFSISNIILQSINTTLLIGGFIVLFSVIISTLVHSKILTFSCNIINPILSIFKLPYSYSFGILSGLIELTNGIYNISQINTKIISNNIMVCAFLLGFGGLSVAMQIYAIISKSNISIKPYIIGKLLQGSLAAFYTYIALKTITALNLDLML